MDPISPKLAPLPPSSPSKIPRRRPSSSSSSSTPHSFNPAFPSSPPSKTIHSSIPTSVSRSSNPSLSEQALQDRRRSRELSSTSSRTQSRTRSRTQSTDLSMDSTTFENPTSRSKVPPLSIHIPHSHAHQQRSTSSSSHPVTKQSIYSPSNSNPPLDPAPSFSSFTPRSRQPSQSHAHSLRTPRSAHSSPHQPHSQQPPMSERPRVSSSSSPHFSRCAPPTALPRDRDRERTNTSSHSTTLATPATYESFDFPLPTETTPREEREARLCLERKRNRCCGLGRLFYRSTATGGDTSAWEDDEGEEGRKKRVSERTRLLGDDDGNEEVGKWEYVWGEVVCYAKHMLPPIFLFVVLVLVIALFAYKQAIRRIIDDRFPPLTEEP
ncbi:hypothetical protein JCM5350_007749 [Sporobolomyces pararoseus]